MQVHARFDHFQKHVLHLNFQQPQLGARPCKMSITSMEKMPLAISIAVIANVLSQKGLIPFQNSERA